MAGDPPRGKQLRGPAVDRQYLQPETCVLKSLAAYMASETFVVIILCFADLPCGGISSNFRSTESAVKAMLRLSHRSVKCSGPYLELLASDFQSLDPRLGTGKPRNCPDRFTACAGRFLRGQRCWSAGDAAASVRRISRYLRFWALLGCVLPMCRVSGLWGWCCGCNSPKVRPLVWSGLGIRGISLHKV